LVHYLLQHCPKVRVVLDKTLHCTLAGTTPCNQINPQAVCSLTDKPGTSSHEIQNSPPTTTQASVVLDKTVHCASAWTTPCNQTNLQAICSLTDKPCISGHEIQNLPPTTALAHPAPSQPGTINPTTNKLSRWPIPCHLVHHQTPSLGSHYDMDNLSFLGCRPTTFIGTSRPHHYQPYYNNALSTHHKWIGIRRWLAALLRQFMNTAWDWWRYRNGVQ